LTNHEFLAAFSAYGAHMARRMTGKDSVTFDPSAAEHQLSLKSVVFSSDAAVLGGNVHCFPLRTGDVATPNAMVLNAVEFNSFKTLSKFVTSEGNVNRADAKNSWNLLKAKVEASSNTPNELFSALDVQKIINRTKETTSSLDTLVRKDIGQQKRFEGQSKNLVNDGRDPFRN
jgi:hypothetical protein